MNLYFWGKEPPKNLKEEFLYKLNESEGAKDIEADAIEKANEKFETFYFYERFPPDEQLVTTDEQIESDEDEQLVTSGEQITSDERWDTLKNLLYEDEQLEENVPYLKLHIGDENLTGQCYIQVKNDSLRYGNDEKRVEDFAKMLKGYCFHRKDDKLIVTFQPLATEVATSLYTKHYTIDLTIIKDGQIVKKGKKCECVKGVKNGGIKAEAAAVDFINRYLSDKNKLLGNVQIGNGDIIKGQKDSFEEWADKNLTGDSYYCCLRKNLKVNTVKGPVSIETFFKEYLTNSVFERKFVDCFNQSDFFIVSKAFQNHTFRKPLSLKKLNALIEHGRDFFPISYKKSFEKRMIKWISDGVPYAFFNIEKQCSIKDFYKDNIEPIDDERKYYVKFWIAGISTFPSVCTFNFSFQFYKLKEGRTQLDTLDDLQILFRIDCRTNDSHNPDPVAETITANEIESDKGEKETALNKNAQGGKLTALLKTVQNEGDDNETNTSNNVFNALLCYLKSGWPKDWVLKVPRDFKEPDKLNPNNLKSEWEPEKLADWLLGNGEVNPFKSYRYNGSAKLLNQLFAAFGDIKFEKELGVDHSDTIFTISGENIKTLLKLIYRIDITDYTKGPSQEGENPDEKGSKMLYYFKWENRKRKEKRITESKKRFYKQQIKSLQKRMGR